MRALQKLKEDKVEIDEESGSTSITEPKKIKAIGLVDFPISAIMDAVHAGVEVTSLTLPFSLLDGVPKDILNVCREYSIKVLATGGCCGGLMSEKYVGGAYPFEEQEELECTAACRWVHGYEMRIAFVQ